jgi:hypothetical protein
VQEEFPNRLVPNGIRRDVNGLKEAAARGRAVIASQEFEFLTIIERDTATIEARWTGTLATAIGPLPAGSINASQEWITNEVPELRIIDDALWQQVKARQAATRLRLREGTRDHYRLLSRLSMHVRSAAAPGIARRRRSQMARRNEPGVPLSVKHAVRPVERLIAPPSSAAPPALTKIVPPGRAW